MSFPISETFGEQFFVVGKNRKCSAPLIQHPSSVIQSINIELLYSTLLHIFSFCASSSLPGYVSMSLICRDVVIVHQNTIKRSNIHRIRANEQWIEETKNSGTSYKKDLQLV